MISFRAIPRFSARLKTRPFQWRALNTVADLQQANYIKTADNRVRIVEVGPRDGLQNEKKSIPVDIKMELIKRLAKTGLRDIEVGSFVSSKWVPQMAASNEIMQNILMNTPLSAHQVDYSFLLPNKRGLDDALAILTRSRDQKPTPNEKVSNTRIDPTISFAVFAAATESFTENNLNCNIATALERFRPVIQGAKDAGHHVRAYISVVLGCPYEGPEVDPHRVAEMATDLMEMGADEIALGDTTGMGTAPRVAALLRAMTAAGVRNEDIAMHFHDTYGQALVNTAVSLEHGIRTFDSSVGGLGGCPFSPGATGNVSTENMIYFLESLGMDTGVDLNAMTDIGQWITEQIGKPNESSVGKAILGRRKVA